MNRQAQIVTHSQVSATGPGTPLTMTSLLTPSRTLTADGAPQGEWNQGQTPLPPSLSLCPSPSLLISPCLSVSLTLLLSLTIYLSPSLSVTLCVSPSTSLNLPLSFYIHVFLSLTLSLSLSIYLSPSLSVSLCLSHALASHLFAEWFLPLTLMGHLSTIVLSTPLFPTCGKNELIACTGIISRLHCPA